MPMTNLSAQITLPGLLNLLINNRTSFWLKMHHIINNFWPKILYLVTQSVAKRSTLKSALQISFVLHIYNA